MFQTLAFRTQFFLFSLYLDFFKFGQLPQSQIQYGFGLQRRDFELFYESRLGLVLRTDDLDDFINIEEGDQQAIEDQRLPDFVGGELGSVGPAQGTVDTGIGLAEVPTGTNLSEVIAGLNALGVSPRDMIDILKSIKAAGALHAEFVVM